MSQTPPPLDGISRAPDGSYRLAVARFSKEAVANKYPSQYRNTRRDRREVCAIQKSLCDVPPHAHLLDIPCGAGRLLQVLLASGCKVTCADSSIIMVRRAQSRWNDICRDARSASFQSPRFCVRDVMHTGFGDGEFDAVICNRLFHHFETSETRVQALTELRRICRGPIAVSFFNAFSIDAIRWRIKNGLRRMIGHKKVQTDRRPIPMATFSDDVRRAGLEVQRTIPVLYGISPMWYVVAVSSATCVATSEQCKIA